MNEQLLADALRGMICNSREIYRSEAIYLFGMWDSRYNNYPYVCGAPDHELGASDPNRVTCEDCRALIIAHKLTNEG